MYSIFKPNNDTIYFKVLQLKNKQTNNNKKNMFSNGFLGV